MKNKFGNVGPKNAPSISACPNNVELVNRRCDKIKTWKDRICDKIYKYNYVRLWLGAQLYTSWHFGQKSFTMQCLGSSVWPIWGADSTEKESEEWGKNWQVQCKYIFSFLRNILLHSHLEPVTQAALVIFKTNKNRTLHSEKIKESMTRFIRVQATAELTGSTGWPRHSMRGHSPNPLWTYFLCCVMRI